MCHVQLAIHWTITFFPVHFLEQEYLPLYVVDVNFTRMVLTLLLLLVIIFSPHHPLNTFVLLVVVVPLVLLVVINPH